MAEYPDDIDIQDGDASAYFHRYWHAFSLQATMT
jgi:hypothetical protein